MRNLYTKPSNLYKKERGIVAVSFLVVSLVFFTFALNFKSESKDVSDAANREYVSGAIYENDVPLASTVNANSIVKDADTVSNKEFSMKVFNLVNDARANNNLPALVWSDSLYNCGLVRVVEITNLWSHTRPNGTDWYTVDANLMYGENLGKGYNTAEELVNAWMSSPSHKENILFGFKTMAVSTYVGSDGKIYVAQEFGY